MLQTASRLLLIGIVIATVGCDRVTKHIATVHLAAAAGRDYFGGALRLEYAENTGGFLSLGSGLPIGLRTGIFTVGTAAILGILAVLLWKRRWSRPVIVGLTFTFAGGASNLFDRVVRGSVIDFINIGLGPIRSGIFNLADVAILIGLLVVAKCAAKAA